MRLFTLLVILSFVVKNSSPTAFNYYFAAGGNDGGPGTSVAPFSNSSAKINAVAGSTGVGDHMYFNRGDSFFVSMTTSTNNGVTIEAYGSGAVPVMYGLTKLPTWANVGTNLWEASVNSGNNLDLVTVNGVTVAAGRTPNAGSYFNIDSHTGVSGASGTLTSTGTPSGSQSWLGAEAVIRVNAYNLDRNLITAHSGNVITYSTPYNGKDISSDGNKFFIQKHPATLDIQNEWYYNSSTHVLRMFSTSDPGTLNVKASTLNFFWNQDYHNNMTFQNLKIVGYDSIGVTGSHPNNYNINHCFFEDMGVFGVTSDTDSLMSITYTDFNRMGSSAIQLLYSTKANIQYNTVDSCGLVRGMNLQNNQQCSGIIVSCYDLGGTGLQRGNNTVIRHNTVSNVGYIGIACIGWTFSIDSNYVWNYGLRLSDGGGIYTNGIRDNVTQRTFKRNVVRDGVGNDDMMNGGGTSGMVGIYLDDDASQVDVMYNTVLRSGYKGIYLHNALGVNVMYNTVYEPTGAQGLSLEDDGLGGTVRSIMVYNNLIYTSPGTYAVQLRSDLNDYTSQGAFSSNFYAHSSGNQYGIIGYGTAGYTLSTWKSTYGWDGGSTQTTVNDDSVVCYFNELMTGKYIYLTNTYVDLRGGSYYHYVWMPANSSLLLYRKILPVVKSARPTTLAP